MKTFGVQYIVRVTAHDQTYPIRDFVNVLSVKDSPTEDDALNRFLRALDNRVADLIDRPGLVVAEELALIVSLAGAMSEAVLSPRSWPAQLLAEQSNDYATMTGRLWLIVTHLADEAELVKEVSDAD